MQPLLFPIPKQFKELPLFSSTFTENFSFYFRAFQAPLKSNIKFQGFSSTSRSSTNHGSSTANNGSLENSNPDSHPEEMNIHNEQVQGLKRQHVTDLGSVLFGVTEK